MLVPWKADPPIFETLLIFLNCNLLQFLNADAPIVVQCFKSIVPSIFWQYMKQSSPKDVTVLGKCTYSKLVHPQKQNGQ